MIKRNLHKEKNVHKVFSDTIKAIVKKHAPLEEKIITGNNAPIMMKAFRKAVMNRSRLKKKYQDFLTSRLDSL